MDISLQILLFIALLILLAKAVGGLCGRVGLPIVLGELLAGVVLGPTVVDVWRFAWFATPSSTAVGGTLSLVAVVRVLAALGVVVLMFLAGLETDVGMLRASLGPAFWSATGGVVLPFAGGIAVSRLAGFGWREAVFIGTVLTATSVSISAQTLMNLKKLRSKAGATILGAAVIDDVLGLIVLSVVIAAEQHSLRTEEPNWWGVGITIGRMALFLAGAFWLGPRLVRFVFRQARNYRGPHAPVALALVVAFLLAFLAEYGGGMAAITGAYLAGLFVAATPAHAEIIEEMRSMTNSFFGPLFFVSIGLEINARQLGGRLLFFSLILTVAVFGKLLGCGLGAWLRGFSSRNALIVGVGMIPRGEVGLITASIGWAAGLISPAVYSLVVVLVLATTLVTPVLLRMCFLSQPLVPAPGTPPLVAELPEEY